ncbi:MAG: ABC transporter substrate-binding protein, partial [Promethearchaeota archaeon]
MKKKRILPIFLIVLILFCSVPFKNNNNISRESPILEIVKNNNGPTKPTFVYGTRYGPSDIDPHNAWNVASFEVINQVLETLFCLNLSDPSFPIIPKLASDFGTWAGPNPDGTWNYTVPLKSGVLFHDGTPFNATAVNFSFSRLNYFVENSLTQFETLYKYHDIPDDTEKLILNRTEIIGDYTIRFILNEKYVPFEALLTFPGSSILSPTSTPLTTFIDTNTGDIVGTGPFVYDEYDNINNFVSFHANEDYRDGKADIDTLKFIIISDPDVLNIALLTGDVDFITSPRESYLDSIEADPNTILLDSGVTSSATYFVGMSNYWMNATFRQAISYATNYTYIMEELTNGRVERLKSLIPEGILYANSSFEVAECNITKARLIMQSMGYGTSLDPTYPGTDEASWTSATFASYNYTYWSPGGLGEDLYDVLALYLDLIGISLTKEYVDFMDFFDIINEESGRTRTELQLFFYAWGADYNDPSNYINILTTNRTIASNGVMYNGYLTAIKAGRDPFDINANVQLLMDAALTETDQTNREAMYDRIQELLVEEDMPYLYLYSPRVLHAHSSDLSGFKQNPFSILDFYNSSWNVPSVYNAILIDDSLPAYNWSKTAADNDWCSGSGTWGDPYIIEDIEVDGQGAMGAIEVRNSNVFFKIRNCTLRGGMDWGLYLSNVNNSILYNLSVYNNPSAGIYLFNSNNHTIEDNIIWDTSMGHGIYLIQSNHTKILHNHVNNLGSGGLYGGITVGYGYDTSIYDNTVINSQMGIITGLAYNITIENNEVLDNSFLGVGLQESNDTIIKGNLISGSGFFGIYFLAPMGYGCINNTIELNQIFDNDNVGIGLDNYSSQNKILQNSFTGNLVNAEDNGTLNSWDNGLIGNIWDDYGGVDADDNGIGDTPYLISGAAGSVDNFPIFDDGPEDYTITITIIEPSPLSTHGSTPPDFTITITGDYLDSTWYTLDSGATYVLLSKGSEIYITGSLMGWDMLPDGSHTIRF